MNIIPAIDLYEGDCVRLKQGNFDSKTCYLSSPIEMAKLFEAQGAQHLHLVDLLGAKRGAFTAFELLSELKALTSLTLHVGGGVRTRETIELLIHLGADKIVLGTTAIETPHKIFDWFDSFGSDRFILALDVVAAKTLAESVLKTQGWMSTASHLFVDVLKVYQTIGKLEILCTDIVRDGCLNGPNIAFYEACLACYPMFKWIASGGVSSIEDLIQLKAKGLSGVVLGKALYEGQLDLDTILEGIC